MDEDQFDNTQRWNSLDETQRRVLAVLIEKAKTTPDNYPISLAALTAGCNQKSNRLPQMQLDEDDVELALEQLREAGVVAEVQGGRVSKYRHLAYDWLGVKGPEIAVMTELLLRGPQTTGELRTRASRMEPFATMDDLLPVLEGLTSKGLAFPLTSPGRGQLFAHGLYPDDELEQLKQQASIGAGKPIVHASRASEGVNEDLAELREEMSEMRRELQDLKRRIEVLES